MAFINKPKTPVPCFSREKDTLFTPRFSAGEQPGVPVRQAARDGIHQQAQDAAVPALLRPALPGPGDVQRDSDNLPGQEQDAPGLGRVLLRAAAADGEVRGGVSVLHFEMGFRSRCFGVVSCKVTLTRRKMG
jgi:hypothetical protein